MKGIDLTQSLVTWFINEVQGILQTKKMLLFSCATRKQSFILKKTKREIWVGEKKNKLSICWKYSKYLNTDLFFNEYIASSDPYHILVSLQLAIFGSVNSGDWGVISKSKFFSSEIPVFREKRCRKAGIREEFSY